MPTASRLNINSDAAIAFLTDLLNTPSPTGYHEEAIAFVREKFAALCLPGLTLHENNKGALIAELPGRSASAPRALAAHVDTLGAMVCEIKSNGRLMLTQIGGYAWSAIEGENVTILAVRENKRYRGTVQTINPSVHTSPKMREAKREQETMEARLDARTTSKDETRALGIDVGDFVFLDPRVEVTQTGFIKSRHLDDKAGVAVIFGVLLAMKESSVLPAQRTSFFISNYEEVGHGAAAGIPRDVVELLVIDMAASTTGEHQNSDEYSVGICAKDSSGPYDLQMRRTLAQICETEQIAYKIDTYPFYGSDGSAFLRAGGDVRVGLIGPGLDASHGYERTHRDSLEATTRLALSYVLAGE
jgi:putative aminopeptidase FrvX